MSIKSLDTKEVMDVINKNEPCVVVLSRENCHVCQEVLPKIEDISEKFAGKLSFYYTDVEEDKSLLKQFSLKGVPQILFFKDGGFFGKLSGNVEEEDIEEKIEEII